MSFVNNRKERFYVEHLSKSEESLGFLDGVSGGRLSWNANASLKAGGTLQLRDMGQDINLSRDRLRIWWEVDGEPAWPLGVYVLAAPTTQYSGPSRSWSLDLIDKLTVIQDDCLLRTFQLPVGANIVASVTQLLADVGETRVAVTDSAMTLSTPIAWSPGTSRLQVINDLLSVAGYWGLWTDGIGQFRVEPYIPPADRPVSWEFSEGDLSIHSENWQYELPVWEATNTVVLVSQAAEDEVPLVAYAVDDNPESPTSTVSVGRVLNPIIQENVEASSSHDLQMQANRVLVDNSNVVGRLTISHAMIPIWYNHGVLFNSQGVDTRATVTKMTIDLKPGAQVNTELRKA